MSDTILPPELQFAVALSIYITPAHMAFRKHMRGAIKRSSVEASNRVAREWGWTEIDINDPDIIWEKEKNP